MLRKNWKYLASHCILTCSETRCGALRLYTYSPLREARNNLSNIDSSVSNFEVALSGDGSFFIIIFS